MLTTLLLSRQEPFTVGAKDSLISAEVRSYQFLLRNIFQVILQKILMKHSCIPEKLGH